MKRMAVISLVMLIAGFTAGVAVAEEETPPESPVITSIVLEPAAATLNVGDELKFKAKVYADEEEVEDAEVTWSVSNANGEVAENGKFKALTVGAVILTASVGEMGEADYIFATAEITIEEEEIGEQPPAEPDADTVTIYRVNSAGMLSKCGAAITEGGTITIGGMPFPLNFLNGMKLTFPEGTLTETITIEFSVPKFAKAEKGEVIFQEELVTGVTFQVKVDGEKKGPYYFGYAGGVKNGEDVYPIQVSLPYKSGLLTRLGLEPEDLGMFFLADDGVGTLVPVGSEFILDEENNLITGEIPHFSTIVVAPKAAAPSSVNEQAPALFELSQNMPNPFNPATSISFTIPASGMVKLAVYNALGQEVRTLVNGHLAAGVHSVVWNGRDSAGRATTSGIYFYRLEAGSLSATKKLTLLR